MPPLMMPPPPPKKSYQPPSKTARDKYFARKTVDEVLKTQVKKRKSEEVSDDAILRSRYERRLERTLQAIQALPDRQNTERLVKTEQAIRTAPLEERRFNGKIEFAEGAGITESESEHLKAQPSDGNAYDRLGHSTNKIAATAARAPATPTTYQAPMSPPPAPRKPKGRRLLDYY